MKREFIDALLDVGELKQVLFGSPADISNPNDEAAAIVAMGKLSYNLNEYILKPLAGLDLTELVLRVGQHNPSTVLSALSNLVLIDAGDGVPVSLVSPVEGEPYFLATGLPVSVKSSDITYAEAWIDGKENAKTVLQVSGDTWSDTLTTSDIIVEPGIDVVYVHLYVSCVVKGKDAPVNLSVSVSMLPGGQGG